MPRNRARLSSPRPAQPPKVSVHVGMNTVIGSDRLYLLGVVAKITKTVAPLGLDVLLPISALTHQGYCRHLSCFLWFVPGLSVLPASPPKPPSVPPTKSQSFVSPRSQSTLHGDSDAFAVAGRRRATTQVARPEATRIAAVVAAEVSSPAASIDSINGKPQPMFRRRTASLPSVRVLLIFLLLFRVTRFVFLVLRSSGKAGYASTGHNCTTSPQNSARPERSGVRQCRPSGGAWF
jgi:hypothetical protein